MTESRYAQIENVLDLTVRLQGSLHGVAIDDVIERYAVSRRTATRMLSAVRRVLGEALFEYELDVEGRKRWRLTRPLVQDLFRIDANDYALLDAAERLAAREGDTALAAGLDDLATKLRALSKPAWLRHVDPDLEALVTAQGFAFRAGPRPTLDEVLLEKLRNAMLTGRMLRILHRNKPDAPPQWQKVGPLGLLYGSRHYLVAMSSRRRHPVLFRLSRISRAEDCEDPFERPADFDLDAWAQRSFGVFQEEPFETAWRFAPSIADEAAEYTFHPTQEVTREADGALVVRFRAAGRIEMAWHLFTWGPDVEVLQPSALRDELVEMLTAAIGTHARTRPQRALRTRSGRATQRSSD